MPGANDFSNGLGGFCKPSIGARIDSRSPFSRGLLGFWLLSAGVVADKMTSVVGTSQGVTAGNGSRGGNAAIFSGAYSSRIDTLRPAILPATSGDFAIVCCIKPSAVTNYSTFISQDDGGSNRKINIELNPNSNNGDLGITLFNSSAQYYAVRTGTTGLISAGNWYHLIVQRRSNNLECYINGKYYALNTNYGFSNSATWPFALPSATSSPFVFGSRPISGTSSNFPGMIDHVGVYSRAFLEKEAKDLCSRPFAMFAGVNYALFEPGGAFNKVLNEFLSLSDVRLSGAGRLNFEALTLLDGMARGFARTLAETLGLSDSRSAGLVRFLFDAVFFADSSSGALNSGGQSLVKSLTESLLLLDARQGGAGKSLTQFFALSDARSVAVNRLTAEFLGFSDSRKASVLRYLGESLGFSDSRTAMIMGASAFLVIVMGYSGEDEVEESGGVA